MSNIRKRLLGNPLATNAIAEERLSNSRAVGAFGLDALSSVAYGPDEILYVLLLAGAAGTRLNLPIAVAIAALLAIVAFSYRQTIYAYPKGGGSFTVASENLGANAGLVAAAALMVDYLTTVAVSVTAGVAALVAFAPSLNAHRVFLDVACIGVLMFVNLRGIREAGIYFVIPTYVFIVSLAALVGWGMFRFVVLGQISHHVSGTPSEAVQGVTLLLVLRAFAGGCTAMTGVEAIANGVPVFRKPESRNAGRTLIFLAVTLGVLFLGVAYLGHRVGALPSDQTNVVAQIGIALGRGPLFYVVQIATSVVLLLAANTSFNGFPMLAATMADKDYFPHQFSHRGLRLAYSNGIMAIGLLAIGLVIVFRGSTHALIPLFAVGVFLCFTLSQAGMVKHWVATKGTRWRAKLAINGIGAISTAVVTVVVIVTKFASGAWIVAIVVPALVFNFRAIHNHYRKSSTELVLRRPIQPAKPSLVLVLVKTLDRATVQAIEYATAVSNDVTALHIETDDSPDDLTSQWQEWSIGIPLISQPSPFRDLIEPLETAIDTLRGSHPDRLVTVVIPEVIPRSLWQEPLHNQTALMIEFALRYRPDVVVASVPLRLGVRT